MIILEKLTIALSVIQYVGVISGLRRSLELDQIDRSFIKERIEEEIAEIIYFGTLFRLGMNTKTRKGVSTEILLKFHIQTHAAVIAALFVHVMRLRACRIFRLLFQTVWMS